VVITCDYGSFGQPQLGGWEACPGTVLEHVRAKLEGEGLRP